jgi:6-phospho-3-hexuloisomerase
VSDSFVSMVRQALDELGQVLGKVSEPSLEQAIEAIATAKTVVVFGGGREGLQIRGFAMRLFHSAAPSPSSAT